MSKNPIIYIAADSYEKLLPENIKNILRNNYIIQESVKPGHCFLQIMNKVNIEHLNKNVYLVIIAVANGIHKNQEDLLLKYS